MKKIIIILFISMGQIFAHEQKDAPVHQRIVYEAYRLLKIQLSKENVGIADIDNYIGEVKYYNPGQWHYLYELTAGSSHEDDKDIVYEYYGIPFLGSHTSITHFWDPDVISGEVRLIEGRYPSAYQKALSYIWNDYPKVYKIPYQAGEWSGYETIKQYPKKNFYLYNYYWKENFWVDLSWDTQFMFFDWVLGEKRNYNHPFWGLTKNRELFYNILGRLLHLLTDMGVPEHAKKSAHIFKHEAPYEHWLSHDYNTEFYWTAEKVYKERGGFVNPFCEINGDKNLFLFYTTAQLSDIFAAFGRNPTGGDFEYNKNIGEIESIYQSYFPTENAGNDFKFYIKPPEDNGFAWKDINYDLGRQYRDALLPYTIRAVAGMLYKFIIESKMQNRYGAPSEAVAGSIFDQQQELILYNQDINGDYYTFRAEGTPGTITVCPDEIPEGYTKDFLIGPDARNVTFRAANEIVFKPGFTATHGSQVHAYTCKDCSRDNQSGNCHQCLQEDYNPQYDRSK